MNNQDDLQEAKQEAEFLRKRAWDFIAKLEKLESELKKPTDADKRRTRRAVGSPAILRRFSSAGTHHHAARAASSAAITAMAAPASRNPPPKPGRARTRLTVP